MAARFDAKAAFAALSPEEQLEIGAAGLLLAYSIDAVEWFGNRPASAHETAESEAHDILLGAVRAAEIAGFAETPRAVPDLTIFGVAQCRQCGCTDNHACPGGCSWVEDDLCSACAPAEAAHG